MDSSGSEDLVPNEPAYWQPSLPKKRKNSSKTASQPTKKRAKPTPSELSCCSVTCSQEGTLGLRFALTDLLATPRSFTYYLDQQTPSLRRVESMRLLGRQMVKCHPTAARSLRRHEPPLHRMGKLLALLNMPATRSIPHQ